MCWPFPFRALPGGNAFGVPPEPFEPALGKRPSELDEQSRRRRNLSRRSMDAWRFAGWNRELLGKPNRFSWMGSGAVEGPIQVEAQDLAVGIPNRRRPMLSPHSLASGAR